MCDAAGVGDGGGSRPPAGARLQAGHGTEDGSGGGEVNQREAQFALVILCFPVAVERREATGH